MSGGVFGVMIDCSRNAVVKPAAVRGFIDKLAVMGYNALMLYTEDTYEVEGEPLFGHFRGRYSRDELKGLDEYAAGKGIELIPCVQTLAHMGKMLHWAHYSDIADTDDILLADEEKTYAFIEREIAACADCFASRRIHIGMDEAIMLGLGKYLRRHGPCDRFTVLTRHLGRVRDICRRYGFRPIMWSDMFFRLLYDNDYYGLGKEMPDYVKAAIPEDVGLVYWDYYHDERERYERHIDAHLAISDDVWFAGGIWKWLGFHACNRKSIERTEKALAACRNKGVNNIILTLWGDDGGECSINAVLPALFASAKIYRGETDFSAIKSEFFAAFKERWDDFMLCDMALPYCDYDRGEWFNNGTKTMLFSDVFLGVYDSSVRGDGFERECFRAAAARFAAAKKRSGKFAALFASYERLCRALEIKYDLGYRVRKAYREGDRAALSAAARDCTLASRRIRAFRDAFYELWVSENKPHGFDVQDIRLGGVIMRLNACAARLKKYLAGEEERIEELEEPMLPFDDDPAVAFRPAFSRYIQAATPNKL